MQGVFDDALAEAEGLFFIIACIAIALFFGLLVLLIWMAITGLVLLVRYRIANSEAEALYDDISDEVGAGYQANSVLESVFGMKFSHDGANNTVDWLENTIFGVRVDE